MCFIWSTLHNTTKLQTLLHFQFSTVNDKDLNETQSTVGDDFTYMMHRTTEIVIIMWIQSSCVDVPMFPHYLIEYSDWTRRALTAWSCREIMEEHGLTSDSSESVESCGPKVIVSRSVEGESWEFWRWNNRYNIMCAPQNKDSKVLCQAYVGISDPTYEALIYPSYPTPVRTHTSGNFCHFSRVYSWSQCKLVTLTKRIFAPKLLLPWQPLREISNKYHKKINNWTGHKFHSLNCVLAVYTLIWGRLLGMLLSLGNRTLKQPSLDHYEKTALLKTRYQIKPKS